MKPNLNNLFAVMPCIGIYLKADYDKVKTLEQAVDLVHEWANVAELTTNVIKRTCYLRASQILTVKLLK